MNRRVFARQLGLLSIALGSIPNVFGQSETIPISELIGKGDPKFYGKDFKLRFEVFNAFNEMQAAALQDEIQIKIVSSYRSFDRQKAIWTRKYKKYTDQGLPATKSIQKIIEYSTIPGTSRHHWGTDIDIVDGRFINTPNLLSAKNFEKDAPFYEMKQWLNEHAETYGFYEVYTDNPERKGFKYEPWHFSYKPLSQKYLKAYTEIDIAQLLKEEALLGSDFFTNEFITKYIEEHILDINPQLL